MKNSRRARRHAAQVAEARRQGYSQGVIAAAAALMGDLEQLGRLDDAEVITRTEDGGVMICQSCAMRAMGWHALAARFEFAVDVRDGGS